MNAKIGMAGGLGWGLSWIFSPALAQAAPIRVEIELQYERAPGAEGCPDAASFQAALKEQLGRNPVVDRAQSRVLIKISPAGNGFEATMRQVDSTTGRAIWTHNPIRDGSCEQLVGTTAVSVSLAIEPLPLPSPTVAPAPAAPPPVAPPLPPPPLPLLTFRGGVSSALLLGVTPGPALAFGAEIGARYRFVSLSLEGRGTLPVKKDVPLGAGGQGQLSVTLLVGSLVPCAHLHKVFFCALAQAGVLRASGPASAGGSEDRQAAYAAVGARVGLELDIVPHVAVRIAADLTGTLQPVKLEVDGREQWATFPVGAALGGGALAYF